MKKNKKDKPEAGSYKKPRLVKFSKVARIQASVAAADDFEVS